MNVQEHQGIRYYLDDMAEQLATQFDYTSIKGPLGLTGDFKEEAAVMPFLNAAFNTGRYYGFDFSGYQNVRDFFKDGDQTVHSFACAYVKQEGDLASLVKRGHLRCVDHEGTAVYFPSETLVRTATNTF